MSAIPAGPRLVARTEEIDDPGPLLALLPAGTQLSWVNGGDGLIAWGETARIRTDGTDRFADARAAWLRLAQGAEVHDEVGLLGTGPVAFGSFAFSPGSPAGGVLVVPAHVVGHRYGRWWRTTMTLDDMTLDAAASPLPAPPTGAPLAGAPFAGAALDAASETPFGPVDLADGALDGTAWKAAVAETVERISAGEAQKVVLARDVVATAERPLDARTLLTRLAEAYPACWTFAVDGLLGATPELLVRREGELISSRVLAGTIARDTSPDDELADTLAHSGKDLEEHGYAVRSVVDALARTGARTEAYGPYVLSLANVLHLATDVTGTLDDAGSLELAEALHPSAAVCGTPTEAAARLIEEIEHMDRDRYAGPVGWTDATGNGEWAIALRCGRLDGTDPRRVRLFAGCGVVAGSDPAAELAESAAKLLPMRNALGAGR